MCAIALGDKSWEGLVWGFMFHLAVHYLADYRDELGDCHSDHPFCRICMDDNGNTEIGECQNRKDSQII